MTRNRHSWLFAIFVSMWGVVTALFIAALILVCAPFLGGKRSFFAITSRWVRHLFRFAEIGLKVEGWDELPESIRLGQQPVIFMSNHESNLDPPVLMATLPIPAVYISKKELKWVPLIGWAAQMAGVIFIDRGKGERAAQSLLRAAKEIQGGKNVVLFPEGTRTRTGQLGGFKKGGFVVAMNAGVPIVPMATIGGYNVLPPKALLLRKGDYHLRFGNPIDPCVYSNRADLMAEVHNRIAQLVEEVKQ